MVKARRIFLTTAGHALLAAAAICLSSPVSAQTGQLLNVEAAGTANPPETLSQEQ